MPLVEIPIDVLELIIQNLSVIDTLRLRQVNPSAYRFIGYITIQDLQNLSRRNQIPHNLVSFPPFRDL